MDTAFFTFSLFASIFAAASRPCLMSVGHIIPIAVPAVNVRPTTTAVTAMSFFMRVSPPRVPGWLQHSNLRTPVPVPRIPLDGSGRRCAARAWCHLGDRGELGHRRLAYAPGRAEGLQEARADRTSHARDRVQHGLKGPLRPELLVVGDREAVRLIPDLLERVERGRRRVEHQGVEALADVDLLLLLGERDHGEVIEAEVLKHLEPDVELAAAAVDEDEVRQGRPLLQRPREPPREDLAERG